jgi:hypothetical protein
MESQLVRKSAICFLVINDLSKLSVIAIQSTLDRTNAPIFIGILDENDAANLPQSPRIQYVKLDLITGDAISGSTSEYQDFSTDSFYQIVQYKWQLLLKLMELDYEYLIYSDTDVYWNLDPIPAIEKVFQSRPSVETQIQSFTDNPSEPKLCMGFVAFRVSSENKDFLRECAEKHHFESSVRKHVGDDDIVTQKFAEDGFPSTILELPQTTFPVGRMLKLYRTKSIMPGLGSPEPYIFHANYVVGLTNKLILIKLFMRNYSSFDKDRKLGVYLYSQLVIKRLRQSLHNLRVRVFAIAKTN